MSRIPIIAVIALLSTPAVVADTIYLKNGSRIDGQAREVPAEKKVVVRVGELGELTLPAEWVDRIEKNARKGGELPPPPAPRPVPSDAKSIATTHVVHFKDGRQVRGDVLESADSEPLKLQVGNLGVMLIERQRIDRVEASAGEILVPEAVPPTITDDTPDPEPEPWRIAGRTLDELIDAVIALRYGSGPAATLAPSRAAQIEAHVYELGRHRSRNRVRAERHLRNIGAAVLPFLDPAAKHPFELSRRAVQRIVRDVGDPAGAPLAIHGLNDSDEFVRHIAAEALRGMFDERVRYRASWPEHRRLAAQDRYWELWTVLEREALRGALLEVLSSTL